MTDLGTDHQTGPGSTTERESGWIPSDATFGARLALIRQAMHWGNVQEAAQACGLATESWRRWERDGRSPRNAVEVASIIASRTGCDLGWLLAPRRLTASMRTTGQYAGATRPADTRSAARPNGSARPARTRRLYAA